MPSLRAMRLRMRSVKNIAQVTKALEAVSGSKVRRAQQAVQNTRAYAIKALQVLQHLGMQSGGPAALHPLLQQRATIRHATVILITSDRGLCGAYNTNIIRKAASFVRQHAGQGINFVSIGRKGRDFVVRRQWPLVGDFPMPGSPTFGDVSAVGKLVVQDYLSGQTDAVYVAYTNYVNALRQEPEVLQLLPFKIETTDLSPEVALVKREMPIAYTYEPSKEDLLSVIVPRFTELQIYRAVLEAAASEHSARMAAMRNATDNAKDLLSTLQLDYNKARQLAITSDLLDIAGGVEALKQAEG